MSEEIAESVCSVLRLGDSETARSLIKLGDSETTRDRGFDRDEIE